MDRIIPLSGVGTECLEYNVIAVLGAMSERFRLIYCDAWYFDFTGNVNSIGAGISAGLGGIEDNSEKYLGIKIDYDRISDPRRAYEAVRTQTANGKAAVFVLDSGYCEWLRTQSGHKTHALVAYGTANDGALCCVDCLPAAEDIKFSVESFLRAYLGPVVRFEDVGTKDGVDYTEPLMRTVSRLSSGTCFAAIKELARSVKSIDILKECDGCDEKNIWNSPIFHKLEILGICRRQYAQYLMLLSDITGLMGLGAVGKQLQTASEQWQLARSLLMKLRIIGNSAVIAGRAGAVVMKIADTEEDALASLRKAIGT